MIWASVWFAVLLASQISLPPAPKTLSVNGRRAIQAPTFGAYGEPSCDADENLFYHLADGSFDNPEVLEIQHDGSAGAIYKLPGEYSGLYFQGLSVTPDGTLYVLVQADSTKYLLFEFDDDGKAKNPVALDVPRHLQMQAFVVWNDGSFLLNAYYTELARDNVRGQRYAAIFDTAGRLRKQLDMRGTGTVDVKPSYSSTPAEGAAIGGDGNAYLLGADSISVMSASGEIVRRLPFQRPEGWTVARLNVSQGLLAIVLQKSDKRRQVSRQYLVLSTTTGDLVGWYTPTAETGNIDVCFNSKSGFEFTQSGKDGQLYMITAPIN
jgi:hypothetical protein